MINEILAQKYCRDDISKIENYDKAIADTSHTWVIHHRLELTLDGEFALSREQLKMHDMYYNRPYYELIFLTRIEHNIIHNLGMSYETRRKLSEAAKGRKASDETRRKLSEAHKGKHHSEDTRRKISESMKGENNPLFGKHHSDEARRKISEAKKGENNPMYGKHHSEDTRRKISDTLKGTRINNDARRKIEILPEKVPGGN